MKMDLNKIIITNNALRPDARGGADADFHRPRAAG